MNRLFSIFVALSLAFVMRSSQPPTVERILFAGNSITWSPARHEIYSPWWGDYGMAATQAQHAFALRVWAEIGARQGSVPDMDVYKGRVIFPEDINESLFAYIRVNQPDVFILQTGEAFPSDIPQDRWNELFVSLGDVVREVGAVGIVAGIFGTKSDPTTTQEQMRVAATMSGLRFVPLMDLHTTGSLAYADGVCVDSGICGHPGDAGHAAIAERILAAIYSQQAYLPLVHGDAGTIPAR